MLARWAAQWPEPQLALQAAQPEVSIKTLKLLAKKILVILPRVAAGDMTSILCATLTSEYLQVLPLEEQQEEQEGGQVLVEVRVVGLVLEWGL